MSDLNDRDYALEVWKKYEDIAVHFNDLIMRWRLQAIGGLATLVTISGFVVGDAATFTTRYRAMLILSLALASAWVGVFVIDFWYYRRLLKGAVNSLLALEKAHPTIQMSTDIEATASGSDRWAALVFYSCGLVPLLILAGWAIYNLWTGQP